MSHYRIAVITTDTSPDIYQLLAPYNENLEVKPYVTQTHEEAIQTIKQQLDNMADYVEQHSDENDPHYNEITLNYYNNTLNYCAEKTDEELYDYYVLKNGYEEDENHNIISTYNPKSKYDYWSEIDDMTLKAFLNEEPELSDEEIAQEWHDLTRHGGFLYNKQYYLDKYKNLKTYMRYQKSPGTYAIVTPDGEWHAPGEVGWFACDDADGDTINAYLDWVDKLRDDVNNGNYDPTAYVTVCDCHI